MLIENYGILQTFKDSTKILGISYGHSDKTLQGWYDIDIPSLIKETISGKRLDNRPFLIGIRPDLYYLGDNEVYISAEGCFNNGVPCCEWIFKFWWNNNRSYSKKKSKENKQKGPLLKIANYKDGILDGRYIILKKDTLYSTTFINGTGYYKDYYPDGTLWIEGQVVNGYRQGEWKNYETKNGKHIRVLIQNYNNGLSDSLINLPPSIVKKQSLPVGE